MRVVRRDARRPRLGTEWDCVRRRSHASADPVWPEQRGDARPWVGGGREPGQAGARRGRRGRVAAATSRQMIILWSPQKSKVMCVC